MTVGSLVLGNIFMQLTKKWPEMVVKRSFMRSIHFESVFTSTRNNLYTIWTSLPMILVLSTHLFHLQVDRLRWFTQIYLRVLCQICTAQTRTRSSYLNRNNMLSLFVLVMSYDIRSPVILPVLLELLGFNFKPTRQL